MLVAGVQASGQRLKSSSVERDGQQAAAGTLKTLFREAGLPVTVSATHIVPLMVGDPVKAKMISDILLAEYGVYVQPINFPTVPRGTERLRFTPGPLAHRGDDARADNCTMRNLRTNRQETGSLTSSGRTRNPMLFSNLDLEEGGEGEWEATLFNRIRK